MTCEKAQRDILLAAHDELSTATGTELEKHLATCAECRAFHADLGRLESAWQATATAHEPAPATIEAIHREAAKPHAAPAPHVFRFPAVRALAYAAGLALLLGTWFTLNRDGQTQRIREVSTVAAMLSTETTLTENNSGTEDEEARLKALALQLLEMEGFMADDITVAESAGPEPTALRSRSTPGSPAPGRV